MRWNCDEQMSSVQLRMRTEISFSFPVKNPRILFQSNAHFHRRQMDKAAVKLALGSNQMSRCIVNGVRFYKLGDLLLPAVSEVIRTAVPKPALIRWKNEHTLKSYQNIIMNQAKVVQTAEYGPLKILPSDEIMSLSRQQAMLETEQVGVSASNTGTTVHTAIEKIIKLSNLKKEAKLKAVLPETIVESPESQITADSAVSALESIAPTAEVIESIGEGILAPTEIDERPILEEITSEIPKEELTTKVQNSLKQFEKWKISIENSGGRIIHTELGVCSLDYLYAGTLDAVVEMTDKHTHTSKLIVIDWKTTNKIKKDHSLQLSAYAHAFQELYEVKVDAAAVVQLGGDYKPNAVFHYVNNLELSFDYFCSALHLYRLVADYRV